MSTFPLRDTIPPLDRRLDTLQAAHPEPPLALRTRPRASIPSLHSNCMIGSSRRSTRQRWQQLTEPELRLHLQQIAEEWTHHDPDSVDYHELENAVTTVVDELHGFGPIGGLFRENDISEILINGPRQVFIERRGQLSKSEVVFRNTEHLSTIIGRLIDGTGRRVDKSSPMLDVRLHDGSRMNVVLNPPRSMGRLSRSADSVCVP